MLVGSSSIVGGGSFLYGALRRLLRRVEARATHDDLLGDQLATEARLAMIRARGVRSGGSGGRERALGDDDATIDLYVWAEAEGGIGPLCVRLCVPVG